MSNPILETAPSLDLIRAHRDEILALAEKHGAYNIRVFGSVARAEATPESDIDLLVSWDYDRVSAWGGVGFDSDVAELLGHRVDVISENGLSPYVRDSILKEAIPL
ncbi:MAG TPA: nucleotidyltransferase family protein [Aggregatilineales bacterium]|nr:nucleotidyltransferase family protein [Aggregatilineales bacterium]